MSDHDNENTTKSISDNPTSETNASSDGPTEPSTPSPGPSTGEVLDRGPRGVSLLIAMVAISLVGLGGSIELTRLHVKAHKAPEADSFCSLNKAVSCLSVAESEYSVFLQVPVSVWTIVSYLGFALGFLLLILYRKQWPSFAGLITIIATGTVLVALTLAGISHFLIGSLCLVCAGLYAVNLSLLILALIYAVKNGGIFRSIINDVKLCLRHVKKSQ